VRGCSAVIDPGRVAAQFHEPDYPERHWLDADAFWADEFDPARPLPTRIEDLAIYEPLTARQNLIFWGRMYGMSGQQLNSRVDEVLEQVSLKDRANDRVDKYSG